MTVQREVRRILLAGFGLGLGLTAFIDLAAISVPLYDMQLYDRVLTSRNMDTLTVLSLACVIGLLFFGLLEYLRSACFVAIGDLVGTRLNGLALEEGIRRAAEGDRNVGPQLARDVNQVASFLGSGAVAIPLDALCAPMFVAVLFMLHRAFGFLALAGISALMLAGIVADRLLHEQLVRAQERRRSADSALSRSLADTELTEGLGMLPAIARRWCARYGSAVDGLSQAASRAQTAASLSRLIRLVLQASVMAFGAILIIRGETTPGSLMGANLLLNKALSPFDHLVESCRTWVLARAAWDRLGALLASSARSNPNAAEDASPGLLVRDAEVRSAQGTLLLADLNLSIPPGTLAILTGPNGSGKTTLLRLLGGVLGPSRGMVLLDGAAPQGGPEIGYLPQLVHLLDGGIGENIARLQANIAETIAAARQAGVHELIGRMGRGYDTVLAANASALSGGMRQRIGLARALYGGPRLLLLDEPDASLDGQGADSLLRALRACCAEGAIAVVISHRAATKQAGDMVIELRDGRVSEVSRQSSRPLQQLETA